MRYGTRHAPMKFESLETAVAFCREKFKVVWALVGDGTYRLYPGGRIESWGKLKEKP